MNVFRIAYPERLLTGEGEASPIIDPLLPSEAQVSFSPSKYDVPSSRMSHYLRVYKHGNLLVLGWQLGQLGLFCGE